jgi:hypothetical protein
MFDAFPQSVRAYFVMFKYYYSPDIEDVVYAQSVKQNDCEEKINAMHVF